MHKEDKKFWATWTSIGLMVVAVLSLLLGVYTHDVGPVVFSYVTFMLHYGFRALVVIRTDWFD